MLPTAATLLSAWEAGAAEAPLDRAPSLLARLEAIPRDQSVGQLTVGQCDARLFELRRALFGDVMEALATCPGCGAEVEMSLSLAELQPPIVDVDEPEGMVSLEQSGYALVFRIPRNDDLRSLRTAAGEAAIRELVERCMVEASAGDGRAVSAFELPDDVLHQIAEVMAARDPGAQTALNIRCDCGAVWVDELHIRSVVWSDLTDWVGRTLTEVHELARIYGWSEAELLSIPAWRRRWYLEAAGC
jgi:hypothetical protein